MKIKPKSTTDVKVGNEKGKKNLPTNNGKTLLELITDATQQVIKEQQESRGQQEK